MSSPALTRQGARSRSALLRAARRVFEKRGYHQARIGDITSAARMSVGSFYTYFESKEELFRHLIIEIEGDIYGGPSRLGNESRSPRELIREANLSYLESFRRNARLWAAIEEAALQSPGARHVVLERHRQALGRTEVLLQNWQRRGELPHDLDIPFVTMALSSMTERSAFRWFVYGDETDVEHAADQITRVWIDVLRLDRRKASEKS